jgi:DNA-binding LacI/PurR family transcriptional regulator
MPAPSTTEIATATGVSQPTVSRILSGKQHLYADATVEKVLEVAEQLGYRPNLLADGLLRGRSHTVGIMVPFREDGFYSTIVLGAHDYLVEAGNAPLLMLSTPHKAEGVQINAMLDRRVDGVIFRGMAQRHPGDALEAFRRQGIPCCSVNRDIAPDVDVVYTDDAEGARQAADHLLGQGHRHMAFVTWGFAEGAEDAPLQVRYEAFRERVEAAGGTVDVETSPGGARDNLAEQLVSTVLARTPRPTAIFMGMDHLAFGAYRVARRLELRIPEDLSLVGFADLPTSAQLDPPLTTVRQDPYEIGRRAAEILLDRIDEKHGKKRAAAPYKLALRPELVVRDSTLRVKDEGGRDEVNMEEDR